VTTNSIAAGRRLAQRAIAWQAVATALVALAFLAKGLLPSLAALVGGGAVTLAAWLSALVALGGGVGPAGVAFARLLMGMALKWSLVLVTLVIALGLFRLPGVPLMAGVIAATLALVLANSIRR
jgi:F0F1-type ATP synthase assembly protein I